METAPEAQGAYKNPGAPEKPNAHHQTRIPEPKGRTGGVPPGTVNPTGVVGRHVDNVGIGGFNDDVPILHYYSLLFCRLEVPL
jgi:hypothetical protein